MRWPTHAAIALNGLWLIEAANPQTLHDSLGILIVSAVFGGLLPDLDAATSKLQRLPIPTADFQPFGLLSQVIRCTSPHRGWMHSLHGLANVGVLMVNRSPNQLILFIKIAIIWRL